jgi:hypothetical protein
MTKTKKAPAKETKTPKTEKKEQKTKKSTKKTDKQDSVSLDELMSQLMSPLKDDQLNEGGHNDCCGCSSCADEGAYPAVLYDTKGKEFYGPFVSDDDVYKWLEDEADICDDFIIFTLVNPAKVKQEWAMDDVEDLDSIPGFGSKTSK